MDVTLPNGQVIKGVPEGTPKDVIAQKAIAAGLAQESDFPDIFQKERLSVGGIESPEQALNYLKGFQEVVGSVASDVPAKVAAGGAGIRELLEGGTGEEAAEKVLETQERLTPTLSEEGQQIAGALGEGVSKLAEIPGVDTLIEGAGNFQDFITSIGKRTGEYLADPFDLAEEVGDEALIERKRQFGAGGAALGEALPETAGYAASMIAPLRVKPGQLSRNIAQRTMQTRQTGPAPAFPRQVNTRGIQEAVRQGFDEGVTNVIESSSRADKDLMRRMLNTYRRVRANPALRDRPSDIAGDSLLERFNVVRRANRQAGQEIDRVARNQLSGVRVDARRPVNQFLDDLEELGVTFDENFTPNFRQSDVVGGREAIRNIVNRLRSARSRDGLQLHRMKRFIDNNVSYGRTQTGLDARVENVLRSLRRGINDELVGVSDDYAAANQSYSETIGALDGLQSVAGRTIDLTGPNAERAVGTLLRRLMGNAQSRANLMNAMDNLEDVATRYGGNFQDDIQTQALFADVLDDAFGPVARTSLQGQVRQGVSDIPTTQGGLLQEGFRRGLERIRNINEEAALEALEELLQ